MADTYTVKKGDTLSEIAQKYYAQYGFSGTYVYVDYLVKINKIANANRIAIGQVIKLTGSADSSTNTSSQVKILQFGEQSNSSRTVFITWEWDKSNTDHYKVVWDYSTGDKDRSGNVIWFDGNGDGGATTTSKQSIYNPPDNATKVRVRVKPVAKTRKVNGKDTAYWTGTYTAWQKYAFTATPPDKPSAPSVTIENLKLTARIDNLPSDIVSVEFRVVKNDNVVAYSGICAASKLSASFVCTVAAGSEYKARCRLLNKNDVWSEWSDYSGNSGTAPGATKGITELRALSDTSVKVVWAAVSTAESYEVEYTTQQRYFDSSNEVSKTSVQAVVHHAEITGMTSGEEYFFRVRAVNEKGESAWSAIKSIVIGKKPVAPTTWSSTTTAITGEPLYLYWVHNAEDNSHQTYAEIELIVGGVLNTYTVENTQEEEDDENKTSMYTLSTAGYVEGTKIQWRVRTAGITKEYGDWSIQRTIDIYAPPTLEFVLTDVNGALSSIITTFPFYVTGIAGPSTQVPISYHVTVVANETYDSVDDLGNEKIVKAGDAVYSKYFDMSYVLTLMFSADNIHLENGISYTVNCVVSMNSGLTAEASVPFTVDWDIDRVEPNAEIAVDMESLTAYITPYCIGQNGENLDDVTLAVYRREFDGKYTEIATGISNTVSTTVTDPHPALDYARYRIVAKAISTGAVSYYDMPGYPVGGTAVVMQWDEKWVSFENLNEYGESYADSTDEPLWTGSMVKLPYNIDVTDDFDPDTELVKYVGREHPTAYYGTQLGMSSTWKVDVPRTDIETLYAIRRLAVWRDNVYVREPSGTGYWANVKVSYGNKYNELVTPVTFSIIRVTGGM